MIVSLRQGSKGRSYPCSLKSFEKLSVWCHICYLFEVKFGVLQNFLLLGTKKKYWHQWRGHGKTTNPSPLKIFEKLGVITCNLVPRMLPFEVKFVLQNYVFLGYKKIGNREGEPWPNPPPPPRTPLPRRSWVGCQARGIIFLLHSQSFPDSSLAVDSALLHTSFLPQRYNYKSFR